jgi:alpha-galactosidase
MLFSVLLLTSALALDNGLGVTPPRGWRSWNFYGPDINATSMLASYAGLADRSRKVDGMPTSLCDLGFCGADIDDGWQACYTGPDGVGFHNASGYPNVDKERFPDMRALTDRAKALGLRPGWYGNNCGCSEKTERCKLQSNGSDLCFRGDVAATVDFGFESVKYDGCGVEKNMTHWAALYNATGKRVLLENCGNGAKATVVSGKLDCPMNQFRSSIDLHPVWHS